MKSILRISLIVLGSALFALNTYAGQIYNSSGTGSQPAKDPFKVYDGSLSASIKFVSMTIGDPDSAIYRVTIQGQGIDNNQMFKDGDNGFAYSLHFFDWKGNNSVKYPDTEAYPITGVQYTDTNYNGVSSGSSAVMRPRPITFQWKGPIYYSDNSNGPVGFLSVQETVYSFRDKEVRKIGKTISIALPYAPSINPKELPRNGGAWEYSGQTVEVVNTLKPLYTNGVEVIPVVVKVTDDKGVVDPANYLDNEDANPYNHLVFYTDEYQKKQNGTYPLHYIGCNPFKNDTVSSSVLYGNQISEGKYLLSANTQQTRVTINNFVKYGYPYSSTISSGEVFYIAVKLNSGATSNFNFDVCFVNNDYCKGDNIGQVEGEADSGASSITLYDKNNISMSAPTAIGGGAVSAINLSTSSKSEGSVPVQISSWLGTSQELYSGFFDYLAYNWGTHPKYIQDNTYYYSSDSPTDGIYALFPQGICQQTLTQRFDFSNLAPGLNIYCARGGKAQTEANDPFHADTADIPDNLITKLGQCAQTADAECYGYIFGQYGNYQSMKESPQKASGKENIGICLKNWSNIPICMNVDQKTTTIGIPSVNKGVFIPPSNYYKNGKYYNGILYYTDTNRSIPESPKTWWVYCNNILTSKDQPDSPADYFYSRIIFHNYGEKEGKFYLKSVLNTTLHNAGEKDRNTYHQAANYLYAPLNQVLLDSRTWENPCLDLLEVDFLPWNSSALISHRQKNILDGTPIADKNPIHTQTIVDEIPITYAHYKNFAMQNGLLESRYKVKPFFNPGSPFEYYWKITNYDDMPRGLACPHIKDVTKAIRKALILHT